MRLALVGWGGDSGVGRELIDAYRHLPVQALFIMENRHKPTRKDLLPAGVPACLASAGDLEGQMERFLDEHKPDTVLTWELPGSWNFPGIWARRGISWKNVVHWDWFAGQHMNVWRMADLVAPNRICAQELREKYSLPSTYLPVPVDTERLAWKERRRAELFISVYGFGGFHDRRSIPELVAAWKAMAKPPPLIIRAQVPPGELERTGRPNSIRVEVGNLPEPADLWETGDIAVQPSRYEGLGLSMLEAQARGVPVIAVNAPPMNEIACELLVGVERVETLSVMGKPLLSHVPSSDSIRKVVESLEGRDLAPLSRAARHRVETQFSWRVLLQPWLDFLSKR